MSAPQPRHSVKVKLAGTEFTVTSEHPPEYTTGVAAYFDAVLARIRSSVPNADAHKAALLAGMAITDELFQGRQGDGDHARRLAALNERLARLVPPNRRSRGSKGS